MLSSFITFEAWIEVTTVVFFSQLEYSCFVILCWFLLYNDVKQLYIHMYPFPLGPHFHPPSYPSGSSQSTVLSLCTMQRVSTGCLCYVWQCTYVSPNSSHPPQPHPHISSLHLCLYSCRTNRFICTTFLDSTYAMILEPQIIKSDTVSTVSPSISHEVMGPDAMIFVF